MSENENPYGDSGAGTRTVDPSRDEPDETEAAAEAEALETDTAEEVDEVAEVGETGEADADDADVTGYLPAYQEPPATEAVAEPSGSAEPGVQAEPAVQAVPDAAEVDLSARMREIRLGFVDDPRRAALEAEDLLVDVLRSLTEDCVRQRDLLRGSLEDAAPDTERMRLVVRRARTLMDALSDPADPAN